MKLDNKQYRIEVLKGQCFNAAKGKSPRQKFIIRSRSETINLKQ